MFSGALGSVQWARHWARRKQRKVDGGLKLPHTKDFAAEQHSSQPALLTQFGSPRWKL